MSRHGRNEEETIEEVRAQRDQLAAELVAALAQLDRIGAAAGMPVAADGTGPIARVQGPRASGHRAPGERHLRVVKVVAFIVALTSLGFKGWRAGAVRVGLTALLTAPVATVAVQGQHMNPFTASPPAASLPGWHTTATPIASASPAALHGAARPKLDAKSAGSSLPGTPLPWYEYDPTSSSPSQLPSTQQSQAAASTATPPVLAVSATSIDLTGTMSATVTLTAVGGSGWVSWRVDPGGTDLDFSATHGILAAGQSCTLTVSLDSAQDGLLSQAFTIDGQQVTVALPPLPAVVPTDAATDAPAGTPTDMPSPAAS